MSYNLTGTTVSTTYGRIVQVVLGTPNTYYDGLREDLLSTGLAAAVLDHNNTGTSTPTQLHNPALLIQHHPLHHLHPMIIQM